MAATAQAIAFRRPIILAAPTDVVNSHTEMRLKIKMFMNYHRDTEILSALDWSMHLWHLIKSAVCEKDPAACRNSRSGWGLDGALCPTTCLVNSAAAMAEISGASDTDFALPFVLTSMWLPKLRPPAHNKYRHVAASAQVRDQNWFRFPHQ